MQIAQMPHYLTLFSCRHVPVPVSTSYILVVYYLVIGLYLCGLIYFRACCVDVAITTVKSPCHDRFGELRDLESLGCSNFRSIDRSPEVLAVCYTRPR